MSEYDSATGLRAPQKYAKFPGEADLVYRNICQVLSERKDQVNWDAYTGDEWRLMGVMAETEGVGPLLYWNFKDGAWPGGMPEALQSRLTGSYYNTLANNTILYTELERILTALGEADIPVIVLKGAALAATVYEDIGLRPMGDLDLLVQREAVTNAEKTIRGIGFENLDRPRLTSWFASIIAYDVGLSGGISGDVNVELHWNLIAGDSDLRSPPLEWFWEQVRQFRNSAFFMEPTAQLLYQSAHLLLKHGQAESRLLWYYDIYLILLAYGETVDWEKMLIHARRYNWSYALNIALENVHVYFHFLPIDTDIRKLVENNSNKEAVQFVNRRMDPLENRTVRDWNRLTSLNWRMRLLFMVALLFPSLDFMRWRYKPSSNLVLPLLYPYRWLEILIDIATVLFKMIVLRNQRTRNTG